MAAEQERSPPTSNDIVAVKRVFDAFARRDLDSALTLIHAHVRLWVVTAAVTRQGGPYVGHDGIREYFRDVDSIWQALELFPHEFEQQRDAVVVTGEVRARGSAGELREPAVWTWQLRDGLVIDCRVDSDLAAARSALGESWVIAEILREYIEAFNRRDVDAMIALADPDIVSHPWMAWSGGRRYVGHEGLRGWMRDLTANDPGHKVVPHEVRRLEQRHWAVLGELTVGDARVSPFASLNRIADGRITEAREYLSEESLLSDLGYLR